MDNGYTAFLELLGKNKIIIPEEIYTFLNKYLPWFYFLRLHLEYKTEDISELLIWFNFTRGIS